MARRSVTRSMTKLSVVVEEDDLHQPPPLDHGKHSQSSSPHDQSSDIPPWTDADVVNLLKAMTDFAELKEMDPLTNINEFWGFIARLMSFSVTKSQLLSKIMSLRLDYAVNLAKKKQLSLSPFEAKVFRLSNMVWGKIDVQVSGQIGPHQNQPKSQCPDCPVLLQEMIGICKDSPTGTIVGERYLRGRIAEVDEAKVKALEGKWKKQKIEELSILARQAASAHKALQEIM